VVKGTTTGTTTDIDGNFRISVDEGTTLVFSYIGFAQQEVAVGSRTTIDVTLSDDVTELTEVVVTALGVTREKAALGYATQGVDGQAVTKAKENSFINSLSGKLAGVQIRTNNNFGGSTNIVIRGNSSITQSNQALMIVDGIPINNGVGNTTGQRAGSTGYDYGSAAADINPEDIESINVLKGAAATALYGARAQNGAVVITTKKGSKRQGIGISLSSGIVIGTINKDTFAEYQDEYGAGYGAYYGSTGYFEDDDVSGDGNDDLVVPTTEDASYGGSFAAFAGTPVYQWDSFVPESPNFGQAYEYRAADNTPADFFETEYTYNNSISLSGGNDQNTFRLSYTNFKTTGILPNSELLRHNFNLNTTSQINDRLKADVLVNYSKQDTRGRNSTGYSDNLMSQFRQWWQVNVDVKSQEDIFRQTGKNYTWNAADYYDPETPIYWDNPYWTRYKNFQTDSRDRVYGKVSLNYKLNDWIDVTARVMGDSYTEVREERREVGSVPAPFGINRADESSGYQRIDRTISEFNYDLLISGTRDLNSDLSLYALAGTNIRRNNFESVMQSTNGGLVVPGLFAISNSALATPLPVEALTNKEVYGFFANVNLGYKDFLYLDLTDRYDISSALPVDNNAYNYYSAAASMVFTEVVDIPLFNYGKLRASYAEVGNDLGAGQTIDTFVKGDNFGSAVIFSVPNAKNNSELVPEKSKAYEVGLELAAFDSRLRADFSIYHRNTENQLFSVATSEATGYNSKVINGGEVENKGMELALSGEIIRSGDFRWRTSVNWATNKSKVISLVDGVENLTLASYQGGISVNATVGQPFGVLRGTGFEYLNGERVVDANGYYVAVADQVIADPNPDWFGGITNTLTYKGLAFSFLIDVQQGGDVYSLDMHYGQGTGVLAHTVGINDLGNPIRNTLADGGGVILPGVKEDGTPNDVRARADYFGGIYYWGNSSRNPGQLTVYDASFVKLREVTLTYRLPVDLVSFAQSIDLSFVGRNLWIIHKNVPYADPESGLGAGNAQGYLSGSYPTVKTYGFKVDVSF
jgi:TonB-linked SusC/RagA family outer membrane protein